MAYIYKPDIKCTNLTKATVIKHEYLVTRTREIMENGLAVASLWGRSSQLVITWSECPPRRNDGT
jgi:hypothetical protein